MRVLCMAGVVVSAGLQLSGGLMCVHNFCIAQRLRAQLCMLLVWSSLCVCFTHVRVCAMLLLCELSPVSEESGTAGELMPGRLVSPTLCGLRLSHTAANAHAPDSNACTQASKQGLASACSFVFRHLWVKRPGRDHAWLV